MEEHIEKIAHGRGYRVTKEGELVNPDGNIVNGYLVETHPGCPTTDHQSVAHLEFRFPSSCRCPWQWLRA